MLDLSPRIKFTLCKIGGNLVSALLIPLAEFASEKDFTLLKNVPGLESDVRGDVVLLVVIAMLTYAYFSNFDAPLRRTEADESGEGEGLAGVATSSLVDSAMLTDSEVIGIATKN